MHGRLKVRTTEEEREHKKKEQALKVKAYKAAMQLIMTKRQKQEYDDEMLSASTPILQRNPDVTTLWNIRRECVLEKVKNIKSLTDEHSDGNENESEEESVATKQRKIQQILEGELNFTEHCLPVNPKSYNIWHHRIWVLENSPQANWQNELALCSSYLKKDERNFHTWDYRRYVVEKAKVPKQKELDFCTEKIKINFSNYSSWHQRSLLLPILYPYEGKAKPKKPMNEEKLKEELEMVLTAAFTDPNDSSAWFYQRWLLGYSRPEMAVCAFRANQEKAVIVFTKPLASKGLKVTLKSSDKEQELTEWHTVNLGPSDCMLKTTLKAESNLKIFNYIEVCTPLYTSELLPLKIFHDDIYYFQALVSCTAYTDDVLDELKAHLQMCENLLEYEPDSKWTLLTSALLMRAIDSQKYHLKALNYLEKLQTVDNLRENYYKDLASKWILENALMDWSKTENIPKQLNLNDLKQLTTLTDPQYLCIADEILLSDNLKERCTALKTFQEI
uniref:Geranylgeranyl transferase type-2 subunit alpha n=1 Tax=Glossina palpalis gambiensis TaxID=67801 RepID=A0A1B0B1P7_9MUSC